MIKSGPLRVTHLQGPPYQDLHQAFDATAACRSRPLREPARGAGGNPGGAPAALLPPARLTAPAAPPSSRGWRRTSAPVVVEAHVPYQVVRPLCRGPQPWTLPRVRTHERRVFGCRARCRRPSRRWVVADPSTRLAPRRHPGHQPDGCVTRSSTDNVPRQPSVRPRALAAGTSSRVPWPVPAKGDSSRRHTTIRPSIATFRQLSAEQRAIVELVLPQRNYDTCRMLACPRIGCASSQRGPSWTWRAERPESRDGRAARDYVLASIDAEANATKGHLRARRRAAPGPLPARPLGSSTSRIPARGAGGRPRPSCRPRHGRDPRTIGSDPPHRTVKRRPPVAASAAACRPSPIVLVLPLEVLPGGDEDGEPPAACETARLSLRASRGQTAVGRPAGIASWSIALQAPASRAGGPPAPAAAPGYGSGSTTARAARSLGGQVTDRQAPIRPSRPPRGFADTASSPCRPSRSTRTRALGTFAPCGDGGPLCAAEARAQPLARPSVLGRPRLTASSTRQRARKRYPESIFPVLMAAG